MTRESFGLASYLQFTSANRRFLGFGFFMALSSSFGQTYFIGVFGPAVQADFGLSHTGWSSIYMVGTLGSAALLPWTGKQIDRVDLRPYTALVCLLMVLACATAACTERRRSRSWLPSATSWVRGCLKAYSVTGKIDCSWMNSASAQFPLKHGR